MVTATPHAWRNNLGMIATMHGKEKVIAPIRQDALGIEVVVPEQLDTDRFGTFSGEVERNGSPLDAARAKIEAGFAIVPEARFGFASEGSFGPHPQISLLAIGREIVVMFDRETGLELSGADASLNPNFAHKFVKCPTEAADFAASVGFPEQGIIVCGAWDDCPAPNVLVIKTITDVVSLTVAAQQAIALCGQALIKTDMRAHSNPTRMAAIRRATHDLVRLFESRCPGCGVRGFDVAERVPGLPCGWCGAPTPEIMREILRCKTCGFENQRAVTDKNVAEPGQCGHCNP